MSALSFYEKDRLSAIDAKYEAQKIAFAPFVFQASKALRDLGILGHIESRGSEGATQAEIVSATGLSAYGVRVLVEAGLGIGLLLWNDEKYILTKTGYFILHDPMTIANMNFVQDVNYQGFFHLTDAIKEGKPTGLAVFGNQWNTVYEALSTLPPKAKESWFSFDHFYSDDSFSKALPVVFAVKPKRLLDVGGNTGKWAMTCVKYNKDVQVTIADLPQQIAMAQQNITGVSGGERISYHPLNILSADSALPQGFDIIWMSQFLDCFSDEQITFILKKAHHALTADGCLFIMETFWDRQKYEAAAFCLQQTSLYFTCIANGNSQMYRSDTMITCIEAAGFVIEDDINGIGISHTILRCKKK